MRLTVCLIVRNEQHTISRALDSVRGLADAWCIIDTGSTDDTLQVIKDATKGWAGTLRQSTWQDFSTNRNELLDLAREHSNPDDWLLLMDADQEIRWTPEDKAALQGTTNGALRVKTEEDPSYWNIHLIKASTPGTYKGKTHEYLQVAPRGIGRSKMLVVHKGDGGHKDDKYQRDLILLQEAVQEDPNDRRSWFYLGNTYRDLGMHQEAAQAYTRRLEGDTQSEEAYLARAYAGLSYKNLGDTGSALRLLHEANKTRPSRHEALLELLRILNDTGHHQEAYETGKRRLGEKKNTTDVLNVHTYVTDVLVPLEWSRSALHLGEVDDALDVLAHAAETPTLPDALRDALVAAITYALSL